jgi:hypothetical protein
MTTDSIIILPIFFFTIGFFNVAKGDMYSKCISICYYLFETHCMRIFL